MADRLIHDAEIARGAHSNIWLINFNFKSLDNATQRHLTDNPLIKSIKPTPNGQMMVVVDEHNQAPAMAFLWACFMNIAWLVTDDNYLQRLMEQAYSINLHELRQIGRHV